MDQFINVVKTRSKPSRLKIIKILQQRPICARNIQKVLDIPHPIASGQKNADGDPGSLICFKGDRAQTASAVAALMALIRKGGYSARGFVADWSLGH